MVDEENDEQEMPSADTFEDYFGEEMVEPVKDLIRQTMAEQAQQDQEVAQGAEKLLGGKVGAPQRAPQPRDPRTQQFQKPTVASEREARYDAALDEILGDDDEAEHDSVEAAEAQTDDATLDQILDGRMNPEAVRQLGIDAAARRRQAGYRAADGTGRVGMAPRENPGFEILR